MGTKNEICGTPNHLASASAAARLALLIPLIASCAPSSASIAGPSTSLPTESTGVADSPGTSQAGTTIWTLEQLPKNAQLFPDLGSHHRPITTQSREAQDYFDQGLRLTYGFNHDEAARSYAKAAALDPNCAICFWGTALTLGPNYNVPLLAERAKTAWDAITRAQALAAKASPVEQALIAALAKRYKGPEYLDPTAMQPYNEAFATAMREVAKRFSDDNDVVVLFAEAMMNVRPWKLWTPQGNPEPGTMELIGALETVLSRAPSHPGANHYYIHAIEASTYPEKAIPMADRLGQLMPGAGHMVHMPAHIYQRVGRYADASDVNRKAIESDKRYLARTTPPGYYPFYISHNYGFLAYSASMEGRSAEALAASSLAAKAIPTHVVCSMPGMDFFLAEPLLVMVRFGRWNELLQVEPPAEKYSVLRALWHHARGMALASTNNVNDAKTEWETLRTLAKNLPEDRLAGLNSGRRVLDLAAKVLEARIAQAKGRPEAVELYREAVTIEDGLAYNEPADWFYPTRHYLGAALLDAKRFKEAEVVYRADLLKHPANGWSLYGVWQSLNAQQRKKESDAAEQQFRTAWARADFDLRRSAF